MAIFPYEIEYYITREGKKPFQAWLENLRDVMARAKIRIRLTVPAWVTSVITVPSAQVFMN